MRTLARPIGLGLAARGDIDDVVGWARQARDAGLDSVWIHDSYYERDAISFGSAVASGLAADGEDDGEAGFRLALGAVNPFTRHPVVLAMTGSALDEVLPGRIVMGLGTGLPLRLKQMGIPYDPEAAVARVSETIDQLRALWAGERLPSATPGLPPIQPMFPPTHRIPLVIAAYRKEFVALAGQKADGYLARPAESIPSLRGILERLRAAAVEAGRDPDALETAGYLLSLVDETRREALNRAKREPFVIYMMSILSDVSLRRAGFEAELRDRIAVAWRAEDYTTRRQPHPRRAARRVHAVRDPRGRRGQGDGVPRRGGPRPAPPPAGPPGGPPDRRARRGRPALRASSRHRSGRPSARAAAIASVGVGSRGRGGRRRRPGERPGRRPPARDDVTGPPSGRRRLGDPPAVRLHRVGHPGPGRRRPGGGRRPVQLGAVPRRPGRRRAPPLRHEHRQRDLRRPEGHRHDHQPAGEPRHRQGPPHRAPGLRWWP